MHFTSLLLAGALAKFGLATYHLKDDYSGANFFNMFDFNTFDDPTHGYVNYVDQGTAASQGLFSVNGGQVTFGVDHTNIASGRGRNSIRLTSKAQYTHALVVLDLAHMPGSICGAWPAFWMTGPNWPSSGEIDIIEGVNTGSQNQMTMHTSGGCTLAGSSCEGGLGCPIKPTGANNYGTNFNNAGGGVYAMQWTGGYINIWFWPRGRVPSDALGANPRPSTWGATTASFVGGSNCNIDQHFMNNNLIFDTTFCGDWAGGVWGQDSTCSALAGSCQAFVQNNPAAFAEAYWTVNSLKVYKSDMDAPAVQAANLVMKPVASPIDAPPVTKAVDQQPTPTSAPREPYGSSETGTENITVAAREVEVEKPVLVDIVAKRSAAENAAAEAPAMRKISRHLHRHVHHLHRS
ncbi:MAG: hypothetical protein L6R41_008008 [Letrouitia leprolyta]|nr:MAG: hypothetical protein L6R41_008008 [Letrouitia leprolyta]